MRNESNNASQAGRTAPTASQDASDGFRVLIEVEYDAHTENEARLRALRDAETLIQQYDVLAVTVGPKGEMAGELFPLTKAYLESKAGE